MAWVNHNGATVMQLTRCFNSFITEEGFNQEIRSTYDLSVLCMLLEVKLHLINDKKHSRLTYSIDFLLNKLTTVNIDVVCQTMKVALVVQPDVSEYLKLLEFINANLPVSAEPLLFLRLFEVSLTLCKFKREQDAFIQYVDLNRFDTVISNLLEADSKIIINYLNVNILPEYLNLNSESSKHLFVQISEHSLETKSLDIFCAIPQLFIENNDVLLQDDRFWYLLQTGLNNNNGTVQKQALYILKKAIHSCQSQESFTTASGVVYWNGNCKTEVSLAWQNLFILYEVAREKQLHLIEPIYQLIPTIKTLHPSWLSSIFRIFLLHPQQAVCSYILLDLLKSNWYYHGTVFEDIVQCLIHVLNKTEFALNKNVWTHLSKFVRNLNRTQFIIVLQESANISWIPPVSYRFYNTMFSSKTDTSVPVSLVTQIIGNLRKLPHKFIRDECLRLTIDYFRTPHFERADFKESIELNRVFFKNNFELWKKDFERFLPDIQTTINSWVGSEIVDPEEVEALLKIIENLSNADLESMLYNLFSNNQLSTAIQDRLCFLFYLRDKNILPYLKNRLTSIRESDDSYLRQIAPLLKSTDSNEIIGTCFCVLLSNESNDAQIEVSFAIVNRFLDEITNIPVLEDVLLRWETSFLENKNRNAYTCLSFLQVFSKKRLGSDSAFDQGRFSRTIQIFEHILETQEFVVVPEIFLQLKFLINASAEAERLFPFIDLCTQKLLELKGGAFFKKAVENFINSVLLNNVILYSDKEIVFEKCRDLLRLLFDWVNSSEDVGYSLSRSLRKLSELNAEVAFKFVSVGLKLLVFGDILKKDQRAEYDVCQIISQTNADKCSKNPNLRRIAIRAEIIKYVQNVVNNGRDEMRTEKADAITVKLLKKYSRYVNKRCFSDSQVHLVKLRILQAILLIHDNMRNKEDLIDTLLNSLCTESHQLSNKFIVIWLLIRLLYVKDNCLDLISSKIESTSKMHSSTIFAFIPVLYHVALLKNDDTFWIKVFKQLLPWTMGAHFNLRLYAQVGIKKLYEVLNRIGNEQVCVQFREVVDGVVDVLNKTEREIETVDKYIFDVFKPVTDFNQQAIYYTIPHITNVTSDEYENIASILNFSINKSPNLDDLRTVQLKSTKPTNNVSTSVIQKKIIPQESVHRKMGELIVVASLVDKIPNLGGISRTSEVFGVKELVINSLTTVKNPEFQNLSMSSENWINIAEVKVDNLQSFLLAKKEKGYLVVGAEQTSESVKLNSFKFPFKCLLLLGNEKEGIPPNLLSLIDACVEIPQLGVVRSLNVHVAAATFIWEYTKAHML